MVASCVFFASRTFKLRTSLFFSDAFRSERQGLGQLLVEDHVLDPGGGGREVDLKELLGRGDGHRVSDNGEPSAVVSLVGRSALKTIKVCQTNISKTVATVH